MKKFLDENFLLQTPTAQRLYHEYATGLPIIDYHCHLPPDQIAADLNFTNLSHAWLNGDHYKWRAMRTNGIDEGYITGGKSDFEKFEQWAATVPYTLRNPLYHWTHLELQRYFDIHDILSPKTAKAIYDECTAKLQTPEFSVQGLIKKMNVETICTTDDPLDNLEYHQQMAQNNVVKLLPSFRPDKAMNADDTIGLNAYIDKLEEVANVNISDYNSYLSALKSRHDYFAANGGKVSDHGLEHIYAEDYTEAEVSAIFDKIRGGDVLLPGEILKFKSAMLFQFAIWNYEKGWVQQFHLGALRNNNTRLLTKLGPDTGFDSIGDFSQARAISKFLNKLDTEDKLAKTIIYNLNPNDNELMATMIGNFNECLEQYGFVKPLYWYANRFP
jgi:glucuronate isomerase